MDPARQATQPGELTAALLALREAVGQCRFSLELPGAGRARDTAAALAAEVDDYLLPRARAVDAPLLAVVGGSTGAGKSTLVNSLVRAPVSRSGVLRPTTRGPVLACHPADGGWFAGPSVLPSLTRSRWAASTSGADGVQPGLLQVVGAPGLPAGLALLDAPDIDSVVAENRRLARELLAAGDLWLFVTTATRYADAVPWEVLRGARDRGTAVAVVLDRVPPAARDAIAGDLVRMLREHNLADAPLFVVEESTLDGHGLLPQAQVDGVAGFLTQTAASMARRRSVSRRTLRGALASAAARADELARAADEQAAAADVLTTSVREAFAAAMATVADRVHAGALLRGEVYARWRELVGSGALRQALRVLADPSCARPVPGAAMPGAALLAALGETLTVSLAQAQAAAAEAVGDAWREQPGGAGLLAGEGAAAASVRSAAIARDQVREWLAWLRAQVRSQAPKVRTRVRGHTSAVTVLVAAVAAVAPPVAEITATGCAPDLLRAVVTHPAGVRWGASARAELLARVSALLDAERDRHAAIIADLGVDIGSGGRLRSAATALVVARQRAGEHVAFERGPTEQRCGAQDGASTVVNKLPRAAA